MGEKTRKLAQVVTFLSQNKLKKEEN